MKKVALGQKDSVCQLALPLCAGRGFWLDSSLYLNGHRSRENGLLPLAKPAIRESVCPFSTTGRLTGTLPLYPLMAIKSAKTNALP